MTKRSTAWRPIITDPPPEGVEVETVIIGSSDVHPLRNQQSLVKQGNLWVFPDRSMYVYYEPTHWRPYPRPATAPGQGVRDLGERG